MDRRECAMAALAAVLVALIIVLIYCVSGSARPMAYPMAYPMARPARPARSAFGDYGEPDQFVEHFTGSAPERVGGVNAPTHAGMTAPAAAASAAASAPRNMDGSPYAKINEFIDTARGMSASELAGHSLPPWQVPGEIERYYRSKMDWKKPSDQPQRFHMAGVTVDPEQAAAADQEMWVSNLDSSSVAPYNTEHAFDSSHDATGYHEAAPLDYNTHITENVLDAHAVSNHQKWVSSMMPWAGTSTSPDTLDEALEATTHFVGLRRPQAIAQHNSLQVTERDMYTFLGNSKFNFLG